MLIQYFYKGLLPHDRGIIDAASGGVLVDETPTQARQLISNMAQKIQRFGTRNDVRQVRKVNEINVIIVQETLKENEQQIANLTTLMSKLVMNGNQQPRACGICTDLSHSTDLCHTLQVEDVNVIGGFQGQSQRGNDSFFQHL